MMIDTVIFDMDGVIIDTEPVHIQLEQELFKELNLSVSEEEHLTYIGASEKNMWEMVMNNHRVQLDVHLLLGKKKKKYLSYLLHKKLEPIDGVVELIRLLHEKRYKLALASSAYMEAINIITSRLNVDQYFQEMISGANIEQSKPHPEIFLLTAKKLNSPVQNCLVIEDSENGVKAAKNAGMHCIGYNNSGKMDLSLADKTINSFSELNGIL